MANKPTMSPAQNELLDVYEQVSRAWLARMKSEVDLWSELATKLAATHSVPEAMTFLKKLQARVAGAGPRRRRR